MAPVLGFDHDVEFGALDRSVVEQALVVYFDDVAGVLADDPGEAGEGAGHVGQFAAQPDQPAFAHQTTHQDRGEQTRVDIAAADDDPDPPAAKPLRRGEHGRDTHRPSALDN